MVRSRCVHGVHCILYSRIHLTDFMFLLYIAQSRQSARLFLQTPELGIPRLINRRRVCPPPSFGSGGETYSPAGEGVTLRSWCDLGNWPYGVKKISIKWLWPVKVTLKVIKRRLLVFCWSCDEGHLKWDKKKLPSLLVCNYGSPRLASPLNSKWSVNTCKAIHILLDIETWYTIKIKKVKKRVSQPMCFILWTERNKIRYDYLLKILYKCSYTEFKIFFKKL